MQLKNEMINITIPSYTQDGSNVSYTIEVKLRNKQEWQLQKRYSQFEELHKKLLILFNDLPELPKKAFITFLIGKSKEQLEDRRIGLEYYLQQIIVRREIYNYEILREFLELQKYEIIQDPLLLHTKKLIMGIRDVAISDQGVMFILSADMNVITRMDAYMNNMKMPWESELGDPKTIPVGTLECYVRNEEQFNYKQVWTKDYSTQAICMYYDPIQCILLIGLDSGNINFLKINEKEQFRKYDESIEIEIHLNRIMGLFYRNGQIHSISKDCKYKVIDMEIGGLKADIRIGQHELTSLTFNEQRKISVVGSRKGEIFILSIKEPQPILLLTIDTNSLFIRGLVLDYEKNYLLSVSYNDGVISVIDIGQSLQQNKGKIKTKIEVKQKSREIQWSNKRGEVFIGNDDGTVTIYNASDLQAQYVLKAHDKAITKLIWYENTQILVTGGKDEQLKWWQFPKKWTEGEIEEEVKSKQIIDAKMDNLLKLQTQNKQIDSDEEDATGLGTWHK